MIKKTLLGTAMVIGLSSNALAADVPNYAKEATQSSYDVATVGAAAIFSYEENGLYSVNCAVGMLTDIQLEPGEEITYIGAGNTTQWAIDKAISGQGGSKRWHIYIKPLKMGISTNMVINTNRRSYQLELTTSHNYNPIINWSYPISFSYGGISILNSTTEELTSIDTKPEKMNFEYKINGEQNIAWLPSAVYDNGTKVYIRLKSSANSDDLPVLFVKGKDGKLEIVNYRYKDNCFIVDRLFSYAELRVGKKDKVTITRG